jgi:hypothetical protein
VVEKAMDNAIQELYTISDKAVKTVTDQIQHTIKHMIPTPTTETHQQHTTHRFPRAYKKAQSDITEAQSQQKSPYNIQPGDTSMQYNFAQTPNPDDTENISDDDWGRFGPEPNNQYSRNGNQPRRKLPELNLFKMVQQVRRPYTGRKSSFAWYFKLRTAVQQYGVLLKPVNQFKRNKNLCPKIYYGEQITQDRYWDMSIALYQLLSHPETVADDNDIQDIVTRHAVTADGYSCLYKIMERIHPVLNKNAKLDALTYTPNCTSIHDYFNQFESYLLYNSLDQGLLHTTQTSSDLLSRTR